MRHIKEINEGWISKNRNRNPIDASEKSINDRRNSYKEALFTDGLREEAINIIKDCDSVDDLINKLYYAAKYVEQENKKYIRKYSR